MSNLSCLMSLLSHKQPGDKIHRFIFRLLYILNYTNSKGQKLSIKKNTATFSVAVSSIPKTEINDDIIPKELLHMR